MKHPIPRRFASPIVAHRVLDNAFASAFPCRVSSRGGSCSTLLRPTPLRSAKSRRRGQALLIAVLLMVFAAVLGATFVTVVALNLNQTARSGSVNAARVAAVAGSNYVNDQLTNSPLGERWNPIDGALPPAPGDADFTYYYNDYERAQGWTRTTPHPTADLDGDGNTWLADGDTDDDRIAVLNDLAGGGSTFAKFPDPRSTTITGNNTPTFLAKVETANSANDLGADPARDGQLKVTIIGRASDNDAASSTLIFYKPTTQNGNLTSFARYDSNWNFRSGKTLTTQTTADLTVGDTLPVADIRGFAKGMTVILGSGATVTYNSVIADITPSPTPDTPNGGVLRLATTLSLVPPIRQGIKVRLASPYVGGLLNIDAHGREDSAQVQDTETPSQYRDVLLTGEPPSGGIMVNNGMHFAGKSQFALKTTGPKRDLVSVAGPISIDGLAVAEVTDGTVREDIKTTTTLRDFVRYQQSEENDPTARSQSVRPLTPARLDLPDSRWLQMTKLSDINNGSQFGYGFGVYIDNKEDFEAVQKNNPNAANNAVTTTFRKMTIGQVLRLLQRKSLPADPLDQTPPGQFVINHTLPDTTVKREPFDYSPGNTNLQLGVSPNPVGYLNADTLIPPAELVPSLNTFNRLSFARIGVDSYEFPIRDAYADQPFNRIGSLEQRGVRGWVSPFEFLPRGPLIELRNNDIIITRDDLSDAPEKIVDVTLPTIDPSGYEDNPRYNHPDETKAWKNLDGTLLTNNTVLTADRPGARTYRMRINMSTGQRFVGAPNNEFLVATKPFNGVIYTEGNVRVRGISDKDITLVSMGTIYIEGGINKNLTGGHVALLAKRNAVLNPTQFAARPAGLQVANLVSGTVIQTAVPLTGPFVGTPILPDNHIDVPVFETSRFRVGDRVTFGAQPQTWLVTKVSIPTVNGVDGPGTISVANPNNVILNANYSDRVAVVDDAPLYNGASQKAYNVGNFARDLLRDGAPNSDVTGSTAVYQLAFVHAGQFDPAIEIARQTGATDPNTIDIKRDTTPDNVIRVAEKQLVAGGAAVHDLATLTLGGLRDQFTSLTMPTPPDPNLNWDLTILPGLDGLPKRNATSAHRLAAVSTTNINPLIPRKFLLTTSVGAYWNNSATPNFIIGSGFVPGDDTDPVLQPIVEDLRTVREEFYGRYDLATNTLVQADFQGTNYALPTQPLPNGNNTIALSRPATSDSLATDLLANIKYDRPTFADIVTEPIKVNVQATIYVQDGSWFVIAMPALTRPLIPAAPTPTEVTQAERYRRLNYQITVKANIAENFAPTGLFDYDNEQTPDQSATPLARGLGAQAQWLDSSSYPVAGARWQTINYIAPDPLPTNNTLYLPVTPDIISQR